MGFSESDEIMNVAAQLSVYAVQANYPSVVRHKIDKEIAYSAYDDLFILLDSIRDIDPRFDIPSKPSSNH